VSAFISTHGLLPPCWQDRLHTKWLNFNPPLYRLHLFMMESLSSKPSSAIRMAEQHSADATTSN
jgi:hypothetical protein